MKTNKKTKKILISIIIFIFGISMIINAVLAISDNYFWIPIHQIKPNMLQFINYFWGTLWFMIASFIIVYSINLIFNIDD